MIFREIDYLVISLLILIFPFQVYSEIHDSDSIGNIQAQTDEKYVQELVAYPYSFFDQFKPITALDMVNQVPGFQLDYDINEMRGFGLTAGNILINDRRPSTKLDNLEDILTRIPAETVSKIELIRGKVRSIDLRGQSTILNLVIEKNTDLAVQWEGHVEKRFGYGSLSPGGGISLSEKWKNIDFNIGFDGYREPAGRTGVDKIFNSKNKLTENHHDKREIRNTYSRGNFNAAYQWGMTRIGINTNIRYSERDNSTNSRRILQTEDKNTRKNIVNNNRKKTAYELGLDLERNISQNTTGKIIFIFSEGQEDIFSIQRDIDNIGTEILLREANSVIDTLESIARIELDWLGISDHFIQANIERAYNSLDSFLVQTDDIGSGAITIDIPGSNSRVDETRWEFSITDTWMMGRFEFNYGLGGEVSRISQTGDATSKRSFFFFKPQLILTYSLSNNYQARLMLSKEVSQLNLNDFVSATVFDENDLALGNPKIQPDTTWIVDFGHEKRFSGNNVINIAVFHHWISNVLDLLPLTNSYEAPGNIGTGRRWGVRLDVSMPLDKIGITNAKMNFKARLQDSIVEDPVTHKNRELSLKGSPGGGIRFNDENNYALSVDFRQDFQQAQMAWGWDIIERAERSLFKVNEFEVYNEGVDINFFIETTRWLDVKMRLTVENILNFEEERIRTIFSEKRDLSPLVSSELRHRTRGAQVFLTISDTF